MAVYGRVSREVAEEVARYLRGVAVPRSRGGWMHWGIELPDNSYLVEAVSPLSLPGVVGDLLNVAHHVRAKGLLEGRLRGRAEGRREAEQEHKERRTALSIAESDRVANGVLHGKFLTSRMGGQR